MLFSRWGANSAFSYPLAGFEGPLQSGGWRGEGKKGREKERKERDGGTVE